MKLTKKNQALALEKLKGGEPIAVYLSKAHPDFAEYILKEFDSLVQTLETSDQVNAAQFQSRFDAWKSNCVQITKGLFESIEWSETGSKFQYAK